MFSLHLTTFNTENLINNYLLFTNIYPTLLIGFFFIQLNLFLIFGNFTNINFRASIKYFFNTLYFIILLVNILFFLFKIFITYKLNIMHTINMTELYTSQYFCTYNSLYGDTIILLCLLTLAICWCFLSERFLFFNYFNVYYFFIFFIFTINMVYSANLLTMFLFFEFIFVPSLYFVYVLGYSKKLDKTVKYLLLWTLSGSFIVLFGIAYIYTQAKSLDINYLSKLQFTHTERTSLYLTFLIGFGIKLPIWPFHYWLTKVHVEAPTGFSMFLSGYLVKTALFCLVYFLYLFKTAFMHYLSIMWVLWGALDASIRMWSSADIKKLIAFATIQEMNLLLCFYLLTTNMQSTIFNLFILVHGLLSVYLFFIIDQVQKRYNSRNINAIGGVAYKFPLLSIAMWLALLIFRGFPVFIKFFVEWELLMLLWENFSILGVVIFFFISFFGVLGFAKIWFTILYGQPTHIKSTTDLLRKDMVILIFIIFFLFILNFSIFIF